MFDIRYRQKSISHDRMTADLFVRVSPKCNLIKYLDKLAKQTNAQFKKKKKNSRFYKHLLQNSALLLFWLESMIAVAKCIVNFTVCLMML